MAIATSPRKYPHWYYFLALEEELSETTKYVEFTQDNFSTYSIEFAHLLLASASEVDIVGKLICMKIDPTQDASKIGEYKEVIIGHFNRFSSFEVSLPRFGLILHPWEQWSTDDVSPFWWKAYNKVKHHRDSHFSEATLKNVLNALAGLFALCIYLHGETRTLSTLDEPKLFDAERFTFSGSPELWNYRTPDHASKWRNWPDNE